MATVDKGPSILIVEDESLIALDLQCRLRQLGYEVAGCCLTAEEALEAAQRLRLDLVLMDIRLDAGRLNGVDAAAAIRRDFRIPVVFVTSYTDEQTIQTARNAGAYGYVTKPFRDRELHASIQIALHHHLIQIKAEAEIAAMNKALHKLSGELLCAQDDERRRLARELHDNTAQLLAGLSMNLALLRKAVGGTGLAERLADECVGLTDQCLREIRTLAHLLHPPLLEELGLAASLRGYVDGFTRRTGIAVKLEADEGIDAIPAHIGLAMFRVIQEGLANVYRHSGSRDATITLTRSPTDIRVQITDYGRGMPEAPAAGELSRAGMGLPSMRERARQLGGTLHIESGSGGTVLALAIPFQAAAAGA